MPAGTRKGLFVFASLTGVAYARYMATMCEQFTHVTPSRNSIFASALHTKIKEFLPGVSFVKLIVAS